MNDVFTLTREELQDEANELLQTVRWSDLTDAEVVLLTAVLRQIGERNYPTAEWERPHLTLVAEQ